jgi:hypothetical protein
MWRRIADTASRFRSVLDHHHPSNERLSVFPKCSFAISGPEIVCCSDRFFRPVIGVIAKRWANLALQFYSGDQTSFIYDEQVPQFCWSEIPGERQKRALLINLSVLGGLSNDRSSTLRNGLSLLPSFLNGKTKSSDQIEVLFGARRKAPITLLTHGVRPRLRVGRGPTTGPGVKAPDQGILSLCNYYIDSWINVYTMYVLRIYLEPPIIY